MKYNWKFCAYFIKKNKAHTRLSPAWGGRGRWMRQEITKALARVKRSCATGSLTAFSNSNTHFLFPPPCLTAAGNAVECQHLITSHSLCLSFPSQGRVSCTGRMMVQAVNQRGRSQRSAPGHMRRWDSALTDMSETGIDLCITHWHMCSRRSAICTPSVLTHTSCAVRYSDVKWSRSCCVH